MPGRAIEDLTDVDTVVDLVVGPRHRPLEGFTVNRVWPTPRRRLIGPFIFFDHMLAADLAPGQGFDVRPHPHIGLATVTWLFEGELMHADSTGVRQPIRPGDVNWMTAGRGITHSERSTDPERERPSRIHGVQSWVALPGERESDAPGFQHVAARDLPLIETDAGRFRLIAGRAFGAESPVTTQSPLFYIEANLKGGSAFDLDPDLGERGLYVASGRIGIDGLDYAAGRLLVLGEQRECRIRVHEAATLMLLGGAPLDGTREIWWNFVSSDPARIEAAKRDWQEGRFPPVPGDDERMPLPT